MRLKASAPGVATRGEDRLDGDRTSNSHSPSRNQRAKPVGVLRRHGPNGFRFEIVPKVPARLAGRGCNMTLGSYEAGLIYGIGLCRGAKIPFRDLTGRAPKAAQPGPIIATHWLRDGEGEDV